MEREYRKVVPLCFGTFESARERMREDIPQI
jgi:hypothetical protein